MTLSYADFKSYIITHLWKVGDSVVINSLDMLISTANSELNRVLQVGERNTVGVYPLTTNTLALPNGCRRLRAVSMPDNLGMTYVTPQELYVFQTNAAGQTIPYYSKQTQNLLFSTDASPTNPISVTLDYYADIPDYATVGTSWVADVYFDVYLYCVLKHTGPFLREDERVALWQDLYTSALTSALEEAEDIKYAGSPLEINFN